MVCPAAVADVHLCSVHYCCTTSMSSVAVKGIVVCTDVMSMCQLLISQHPSIELEFSAVLSDVAGGVNNGWLGQQFSVCVWSLLADCRVDVVAGGRMVVFVQCD